MQASEAKIEQQLQPPPAVAAELPAGLAEERPPSPAAAKEESCCAVPSRRRNVRPWLIGGALLLAVAGYAGWDWLVAMGVATVLLAVGPCLLMCALGLCMARGKSKGEMSPTEIRKTYEADAAEPPNRG